MANKNKHSEQKAVPHYLDLFYMTPSKVSAKDIAMFFKDAEGITVELWEEMNVLELELSNQNTVDFEPLDINFSHPSDLAFIKNRNIQTVFAVSLTEGDLTMAKPYFERLVAEYSGFLCSDTEDFNPVYVGSPAKG